MASAAARVAGCCGTDGCPRSCGRAAISPYDGTSRSKEGDPLHIQYNNQIYKIRVPALCPARY